ncbi:MAG: hypothetical protein Q7T69_02620 [Rhodoferax sp.]|nr:hypothetical protein [Rhodoferax sp.]
MNTHPIDLEARAPVACKRPGAARNGDGTHHGTFNARLHAEATTLGAAMAAYARRTNGRLRRVWRWHNTA